MIRITVAMNRREISNINQHQCSNEEDIIINNSNDKAIPSLRCHSKHRVRSVVNGIAAATVNELKQDRRGWTTTTEKEDGSREQHQQGTGKGINIGDQFQLFPLKSLMDDMVEEDPNEWRSDHPHAGNDPDGEGTSGARTIANCGDPPPPDSATSSSGAAIVTELGPYDIVCGHNNAGYDSVGNRRFRATIQMNLQRYVNCPSKKGRTNIIGSIVRLLREQAGARFLKEERFERSSSGQQQRLRLRQSRYTIMTQKQAHEKVCRSFGDLMASRCKREQQQPGATKKKKKAPTVAAPNFEAEVINCDAEGGSGNIVTELGPYDIVCGRNNGAYNCVGNRRFRLTIEMNLQRYVDCPTREDRTTVVKAIVGMLREQTGARFLRKETFENNNNSEVPGSMPGQQPPRQRRHSRYIVMTEKEACKKVYRSFCDLIAAPSRKEEQRGGTKAKNVASTFGPELKLPGRLFGQNAASKSWQDM